MLLPVITRKSPAYGNQGDYFIYLGLKYFLVKLGYEPYLLDKFNLQDIRDHQELIKEAGKCLLAGMPQFNNYDDWIFPYDKDLYDLFVQQHIPLYSLAGGSGVSNPDTTIEEYVSNCLNSRKTNEVIAYRQRCTRWLSVRDHYSERLLSAFGSTTQVLPCTGFWASQGPNNHLHNIICTPNMDMLPLFHKGLDVHAYALRLISELRKKYPDYLVVAHSERDFRFFSLTGSVYFSNDPAVLQSLYQHANKVISARVHCSLPCAGNGANVLHLGHDIRSDAVELCQIPVLDFYTSDIIDHILAAEFSVLDDEWKANQEDKYLELLRSIR